MSGESEPFEVSPFSSTSSLHPDGGGHTEPGDISSPSSASGSPRSVRSPSGSGSRASLHSSSEAQSRSHSRHQHSQSHSRPASRQLKSIADGVPAPPEPFNFENSTLTLLQQQEQSERLMQQPEQHQFIQNILQPLTFSSTSGVPPSRQQTNSRQQHRPQQQVQFSSQPHPPSKPQQQPQPQASSQQSRTADLGVRGDHSSFLIQDRIHFFERYAVQPKVARHGDSHGTGSKPTDSQFSSAAPNAATSSPHYSRNIPAHASPYGSALGQPAGSYSDRSANTLNSLVGERQKPSKTLSGSGAPLSILQNNLSSSAIKQKALLASRSPTMPTGFGSSRIKDTTLSIAPTVAERIVTQRRDASYDEPNPAMKIYYPNIAATGPASHFGKAARFIEPETSDKKKTPSASHRQWGDSSGKDLPPYLDANTARAIPVNRKTRAETLLELAGGSEGVNGVEAEVAYGLNSTRAIPNGLGGYILENGSSELDLTNQSRHLKIISSALSSADAPSVGAGSTNMDLGAAASTRGTISMADHCRLVNEALSRKTLELLSIYQEKLQTEQKSVKSDYYSRYSTDRADLEKIIKNYQNKLREISGQFHDLTEMKSKIHELKLSNSSLRIFNLELARNYDAELNDMRLEIELLQNTAFAPTAAATTNGQAASAGATSSSSGGHATSSHDSTNQTLHQVAALERHIQLKDTEKRALEKEIDEVKGELEKIRPYLEEELSKTSERSEYLTQRIATFNEKRDADYSKQAQEIYDLQQQIGTKLQSNVTLQTQVEKLRKSANSLRGKLLTTEKKLQVSREAYENEVNKGLSELETLQTELETKSHAFNDHFLLIRTATEICSAIDSKLKMDLLCRNCLQLLEKPMLLWPCGHTLCESCVTRTELDGSPYRGPKQQQRRSDTPDSPMSTSSNSNKNEPGYILICTECKYNFDHPVHRDDDSDTLDGEDVSFPNPFFDPPPNFTGRFYYVPNMIVTKLVQAYNTCSSRLREMLPKFHEMTKTVDVFSTYLTQSNPTRTHQLLQAAAIAAGEHIQVTEEDDGVVEESKQLSPRSLKKSSTASSLRRSLQRTGSNFSGTSTNSSTVNSRRTSQTGPTSPSNKRRTLEKRQQS